MQPDLPAYLGRHGVQLIGVDLPSVDAPDSVDLPVHHALSHAGIQIVEGLYLEGAAPGMYELLALPMLVDGADAAPVRALLREA